MLERRKSRPRMRVIEELVEGIFGIKKKMAVNPWIFFYDPI